MSYKTYAMLPQTEASLEHILQHREQFLKARRDRGLPSKPLVVCVSGCQGSGKTTLSDTLVHILREEPYNLSVVAFSLDDIYLTRNDQVKLAENNPGNQLLQFRGQAGSHDLSLAQTVFKVLLENNGESVRIPSYDKSLHAGRGDRLDESAWKEVYGPLDIVLFEGWSLGFKPLPKKEIERLYQTKKKSNELVRFTQHPIEHIQKMNEYLRFYERDLYPLMDIFIHLSPENREQVYHWRLEQEHHAKESRGVEGLSDEAVREFVDTYMPAYELYLPRLIEVGFFGQGRHGENLKDYEGLNRRDGGYSGAERHMHMTLDQDRRVIRSQRIKESVLEKLQTSAPGDNKSQGADSRWINGRFIVSCTLVGILGFMVFSRRQHLIYFISVTSERWRTG
ncbi:hypothetical protein DFQ28_008200 [Apophysomyces sp. BC1034]|nr:hypothetical protein DFQ30_007710 [Apophysomyces sp. BC1015]KAG0181967.1 hypothetical protein DFQ29_006364 [Apophysomyces sp. BC1021]KAG0192693.1 hypothetical protein DFQ28_008200 [Apophysomyces sp. BC1034]